MEEAIVVEAAVEGEAILTANSLVLQTASLWAHEKYLGK